jgi:hypothetical protein
VLPEENTTEKVIIAPIAATAAYTSFLLIDITIP